MAGVAHSYPPLEKWQHDLVLANRGLIKLIAKPYFFGPVPDDAMSEGYLALCLAAQRFEPSRNLKFSTYAVYWIRALILQYILANRGPIRIGTTRQQRKVFFGLHRVREALGVDHQNDYQMIADELGVEVRVVEEIAPRVINNRDYSLDAAQPGQRPRELICDIPDPETEVGESEEIMWRNSIIKRALLQLNERDRYVLRQRHFHEPPRTLAWLSHRLGVSRERIRQLEMRGMEQLTILLQQQI